MLKSLKRRIVSFMAAAVMAVTNTVPIAPISAFSEDVTASQETELTMQTIEVSPDEDNSEKVITLEGMMPEGATAEAVDVSEDYEGFAAYDITITEGGEEFQPDEENPIKVEITDPAITEVQTLQLWHIKDDGEREQIFDFTVEEGKISFYAEGFSIYVYDIVDGPEPIEYGWINANDVKLLSQKGSKGFYLSFYADNVQYYLTDTVAVGISGNNDRNGLQSQKLIDITDLIDKTLFYFGKEDDYAENEFYIYVKESGENGAEIKKYLKMTSVSSNTSRSGLSLDADDSLKTKFSISKQKDGSLYFSGKVGETTYYLTRNTNKEGVGAVAGYSSTNKNTPKITLYYYAGEKPTGKDFYDLDGKTYGLMYLENNSTLGYAMTKEANDKNNALKSKSMFIRTNTVDPDGKLYVSLDSDITMWTFHSVEEDRYTISADNGKYLKLDADTGLTLVDSSEASEFTVIPGTGTNDKKILLSCGGKSIKGGTSTFGSDNSGNYLYFVEKTDFTDEDFVVYSAAKVGVSEKESDKYVVRQGSQILIYTRVWNQQYERYDFYAINHKGQLVPCYESGNSIMWVGSKINSLLWDFIEYYYEGTETLNGYYDLYNPYSGKYLVPQDGGAVLSDTPVGNNLDGRRDDEYFSKITSWDDVSYSYFALKADTDKGKVISVPKLQATDETSDFYFAIMEPLKPEDPTEDTLTPVETIDNESYGITMKMVDFNGTSGRPTNLDDGKQANADTTVQQHNVLGNSTYVATPQRKGLLSTDLSDDSTYPEATITNKSFRELFGSATEVNHLFIKSIYDATGYFEFDSCQNYATLIDPDTNTLGNEFTVYKELGTTNVGGTKHSLQHGQFMPYNTIEAGKYADETKNGLNLYNAIQQDLPEDDPRKHEKLYLIDNPDYYHGMELSAGFVQTTNGQDAWGHDIIFEFTGDDDFWLYVDGELVIDLGGIHGALEGKVNFHTGNVVVNGEKTTLYDLFYNNYLRRVHTADEALTYMRTEHSSPELTLAEIQADETMKAEYDEYLASKHSADEALAYVESIFEKKTIDGQEYNIFKDYSSHTMKIFYMERGAGASNLHMRFNLSYVTPGSVVMSKEVDGAGDIDYSLLKYPYQIEYLESEDGDWKLLEPQTANFGVYYLNPKREAEYYPLYKSSSNGVIYKNIYFLYPGKDVSISFPADTIAYRITECGLNPEVYGSVDYNGKTASGVSNNGEDGNGKDFKIVQATVKERPNLKLTNKIDPDAVKTLTIVKKLVDKNGDPIDDDGTTFNFRLYLEDSSEVTSSGEGENANVTVNKQLKLAYKQKYYVVDPDGYMCTWDKGQGKLVASSVKYTELEEQDRKAYAFESSINGQISNIPAKYQVKVPNMITGMKFKVEERETDNPIGYNVYKLNGYACVKEGEIDSYYVENGSEINVGTVIAGASPSMLITNQRGYGIEVTKVWSDADYTDSHDPVYIAVYIVHYENGVAKMKMVDGTLREINDDNRKQRYFFEDLEEGRTLENYHVFEVVRNPESGEYVPLPDETRTDISAVPSDASENREYKYQVKYKEGEIQGVINNARIDTIENIRTDGIAIRLYDWGSMEHPLANGKFSLTLTEPGKDPVDVGKGTYISDSNGTVAILYSVSNTGTYTLTETKSPTGYIGLPRSVSFTVDAVRKSKNGEVIKFVNTDDAEWLKNNGWLEPDTIDEKGIYRGVIDIHNKPFELKALKIDGSTKKPLQGASFALYRGVLGGKGKIVKDYDPMDGCGALQSDADGVIPKITENLTPGIYFLTEKTPPDNYTGLTGDVEFKLTDLGEISLIGTLSGAELRSTEDADSNRTVLTLEISNYGGSHDYYFDIEKIVFLDKYIHGSKSDSEQKFVFKVERFTENDTEFASPVETFLVALGCNEQLTEYPYPDDNLPAGLYSRTDNTVTTGGYTFPASVFSGKQTVKVSQPGLYRVTEVTSWSSTDYDFVKGTNIYLPGSTGTTAVEVGTTAPYVAFTLSDKNTSKDEPAKASFTNTETEYAYLSSQAYAENTIKK